MLIYQLEDIPEEFVTPKHSRAQIMKHVSKIAMAAAILIGNSAAWADMLRSAALWMPNL